MAFPFVSARKPQPSSTVSTIGFGRLAISRKNTRSSLQPSCRGTLWLACTSVQLHHSLNHLTAKSDGGSRRLRWNYDGGAMPFSLDYDAIGFLWTTAVVLFGSKPQLRKNTAPIPAHYKREVIEESALTDAQEKYFAPVDAQLAALNYRPFCTFRVANYGSNLLREYLNPADPANCTVTVVEVQTNVKGMQSTRGSQVVSFTTR